MLRSAPAFISISKREGKYIMKYLASFAILSFAAILGSCTAPSEPAPLSSSADAYFFQSNITLQYTYSEDNTAKIDTNTYAAKSVDNLHPYDSYLKLERSDS